MEIRLQRCVSIPIAFGMVKNMLKLNVELNTNVHKVQVSKIRYSVSTEFKIARFPGPLIQRQAATNRSPCNASLAGWIDASRRKRAVQNLAMYKVYREGRDGRGGGKAKGDDYACIFLIYGGRRSKRKKKK